MRFASLTTIARLAVIPFLSFTVPGTALHAQPQFPSKTIEIVVPYPPGASTDLMARILQPSLSAQLKQTVIIDNRGGAGGDIGATHVAKSPPDGYRLLLCANATTTINPFVTKSTSFDASKDLVAVAKIATGPMGIAVRTDSKINSLAELVAKAKAEPGKLSFGSAGNGSPHHLIGELLNQRAGIRIQHVPYRGISPALNDLLGGNIDVVISTLAGLKPLSTSGKIKVLAISDAKRFEGAPNIPTIAETYPGFDSGTWFGIYAPAGTPPDVIKKLNAAFNTALATPEVKEKFLTNLLSPSTGTPEAFAELTRKDAARWAKLIKEMNIHAD